MGERLTIGPVRASYMNVGKARLNSINDQVEFSVVCLIPKEDNEHCKDSAGVLDSVKDVVKRQYTEMFGTKKADSWKNPLKDGDADGRNPGYWYFNTKCSEDRPPKLVNSQGIEVPSDSGWNSGDWIRVNVYATGFDRKGIKGVTLLLNGVQFVSKGEPLGGGGCSFDPVEGGDQGEEYDPFAE